MENIDKFLKEFDEQCAESLDINKWDQKYLEYTREISMIEDMMERDFEEGVQEMEKHRRDHEGE